MDHYWQKIQIKQISMINLCLVKEPTMANSNPKRKFKIIHPFLIKKSLVRVILLRAVIDANSKFWFIYVIFNLFLFRITIKYTLILWVLILAALKANSIYRFIEPNYPYREEVDAFVGGWWFWLALLPPVNVGLTLVLGRYLLAMTLFPY